MLSLTTTLSGFTQFRPSHVQLLVALIPILFGLRKITSRPARPRKIPYRSERVLVLGATGGIGRAIAQEYASRGANVCVVGRRQAQLDEVVQELGGADGQILGVRGDFANVEDMVRVRATIEEGVFH